MFFKKLIAILVLIAFTQAHLYAQEKVDVPKEGLAKSQTPEDMNIFVDYKDWPQSTSIREDDLLMKALYQLSRSSQFSTAYSPTSFIDINGDGLNDLLIHKVLNITNGNAHFMAVFLNQGNLKFTLAYKCVQDRTIENNISVFNWYGDCAQQ